LKSKNKINRRAPEAHEKEIPMKKAAPQKMILTRETLGTLNDKDMKASSVAPCRRPPTP